jgi:polysaccharide chain length determinant protein (PEP-CTERM system associated)
VLPGKKFTPQDILAILGSRWWMVAVPTVLGLAAGLILFEHIPKQYRSETLIMVVPQTVPDDYVKSTVSAPIEDRLSSISDQILSRSRLERIITDFDLYEKERTRGLVMEDLVRGMRTDITVKVEGKESFRVSYLNEQPQTAQKVTERLASLFIEENLRDRENLAENTNQFLESQLEDARQRLLAHEKKLEAYNQRYSGELPTQLQGNLQAIQNGQMQLQSLQESTNRARERRLLLERQLADAQSLQVAAPPVENAPGPADGPVPMTTAQQLEAARSRLALFRMRYTADHPDVKALERTIRELQAKLQAEGDAPQQPAPKVVTPAEAARIKHIQDLQAEIAVIDHQLASNETEADRLKKDIASYQARVDALPARQSDLVELTRDYSTLQQTYASLLQKHEDAKIAANLERRQIGESFKVLDPAFLPQRPYNNSKRLGAVAGGLGGGLLLGLGVIALLEFRDSSFKREQDVVQVLSLPVLALIPVMPSASADGGDGSRRKRRIAAVLGALFLVVVSAAALFALRGRF